MSHMSSYVVAYSGCDRTNRSLFLAKKTFNSFASLRVISQSIKNFVNVSLNRSARLCSWLNSLEKFPRCTSGCRNVSRSSETNPCGSSRVHTYLL